MYCSSRFAGLPLEFGEGLQPEIVQYAQAVDRRAAAGGLAQRGLVGAGHRELVLVDAVFALGAIDAFVRFFVAEFDDLDALHLPAHRIEVLDRVEEAIDGAAAARHVRTDVGVGLRCGVALLRGGRKRSGREAEHERRDEQVQPVHAMLAVMCERTHRTPPAASDSSCRMDDPMPPPTPIERAPRCAAPAGDVLRG